jgi:hypothetical protein
MDMRREKISRVLKCYTIIDNAESNSAQPDNWRLAKEKSILNPKLVESKIS